MAKSMRYDHPAYTARHSSQLTAVAGTAGTTACKFVAFTAQKIKAITANVDVAGTNTAAAYTINHGTDSVGTIAMSTNAAATALTATLDSAIELAAGEYLQFLRIASQGATMAASIQVEWEIVPRASVT